MGEPPYKGNWPKALLSPPEDTPRIRLALVILSPDPGKENPEGANERDN